MTRLISVVTVALLGATSCHRPARPTPPPPEPTRTSQLPVQPEAAPLPPPVSPPFAPAASAAADNTGRVLIMESGSERWLDEAVATQLGYTILDLSDNWTPFIFAEHRAPTGEPLPNRYRRVFIGLANNLVDEDGQPLPPGEKRYLELYGIPPSLSVLRARFLEDASHPCHANVSLANIEAVDAITYIPPERVTAEEVRLARVRRSLENARRAAGVPSLAELAGRDGKLAAQVKLIETRAAEKIAMTEVERRLACEGFLTDKSRHRAGVYDDAIRSAVKRFQQKHMIYEGQLLRRKTMEALARPPVENDLQALHRVLRERVVSAAAIVEDGSASGATYLDASGARVAVPNLADDYTKVATEQLGLATVEGALAFLRRHDPAELARLRVGVKLPPRPEYYGPHMDLAIVIDRGDVWYDPPFDANGEFKLPSRKKLPSFTLYVRHRGQKVALVRWRTTIGGWRAEQASDGYEYFRYKGSDVGPRVIRQILAGPVWIAPATTPIRTLTKGKEIQGRRSLVVNYDELGPGYLSAYGLVAGYFVVPGKDGRPDWDNGIRAHGSAEYLSMYSANGYSHGCHRLPNHLAIRLYSFVLRHRNMRVAGDLTTDFLRQFLWKDAVFELRIPSRGYGYQLEPPLPVDVLEGDIRGGAKKPILGYVPKPGMHYPGPPPPAPDSPEARAGGAGAAAAVPRPAQGINGEPTEETTP